MAGIRELVRFDGFGKGNDEAEEVGESRRGVEPDDVVLAGDYLDWGLEAVRWLKRDHFLGLWHRSSHNGFFGVGWIRRKIDGREADGDIGWVGGRRRWRRVGGGPAAVYACS